MDKLNKLIEEYHASEYHTLPQFIKRRVDALKKIQLEHTDLEHKYHLELRDLELKYEKLYQPLYERRNKIISGQHEPTDEECKLPPVIIENDNGDQENIAQEQKSIISQEDEKELKTHIKGIPGFWLGCFSSTFNFYDSIEQHDRKILKHLKDVKLSYGEEGELCTYKIEFYFDENPYFTNKVLTKTYYLKLKPDEKDPFSYEGFEVYKSEGCKIEWNQGENVTVKTITVKQKNKKDGRMREKRKEVEQESFFYFFSPPQMPEKLEDADEELNALVSVDFELGEIIRLSLIPKAPLFYCGYMLEEEEDDEDEEEETDDSDDSDESLDLEEDSDEANGQGSDAEEVNGSKDSLIKDKKGQ